MRVSASHQSLISIFSALLIAIASLFGSPSRFANAQSSIVIDLDRNVEECFTARAPGPGVWYLSGYFEVLGDHQKGTVTAWLTDKTNRDKKRLWSSADQRQTEEYIYDRSFHFEKTGVFELCFVAKHQGNVQVGFDFHTMPTHEEDYADTVEDKYINKIVQSTYHLERSFTNMLEHQNFMSDSDNVHRHLIEGTFTKVVRWNLLKTSILLAAAIGQVCYIRGYLEKNNKRY